MTPSPRLTCERTDEAGTVTLAPAGEIDVSTAPQMRELLVDAIASGHPVVVDLGAVTFIDSTGIGVFVMAHKRLDANGSMMVLCAPTEQVRALLEITGLDAVMACADTREAARRLLDGA